MTVRILLACLLVAAMGAVADDDDEGFDPIFNGMDLSGWVGAERGYKAEDGVLVADSPSGNLYTEAEYGDFVLRFSFKLTPGGNNGIGVRVPLDKRASKEGLEIQVLDDTAEKYAGKLKPWQHHGSVYGIVPAEPGHLRPVGEWNEQEIRVEGTKVRVTLNGAVIVDTDLEPWRQGKPFMDDKEHPGVMRDSGRISLAGHKSEVHFRDLRVKRLDAR